MPQSKRHRLFKKKLFKIPALRKRLPTYCIKGQLRNSLYIYFKMSEKITSGGEKEI